MKILSLFAHPDDETMLSGGTLAYLAKAGHEVVYVCATRGEGGERGEPPFCEPEQLGEFRANELTCAIAALGGGKLIYLDYIDPFIGPEDTLFAYSDDEEEVIQKILLILSEEKPDVVITHGSSGEYGHPAHLLTHRAALAAYAAYADPDLQIYTVFAAFDGHPKPRNVNVNDAADIILDLEKDPAVLQAKIDGALCHQPEQRLWPLPGPDAHPAGKPPGAGGRRRRGRHAGGHHRAGTRPQRGAGRTNRQAWRHHQFHRQRR